MRLSSPPISQKTTSLATLPVDDAERDEQGGDGGGQRPEGDAGQQQRRDGGAPGAGWRRRGRRRGRPAPPAKANSGSQKTAAAREPADERDHGAQRRALADADDAGLGEGVAEEPLHLRPRHPRGAPPTSAATATRGVRMIQTMTCSALGDAPEVDPAGRQRSRREHPDDGAPGDAGAADGDRRHYRRRESRAASSGRAARAAPRTPGRPSASVTARPDVPDGLRPADPNRDAPRTVSVTARPEYSAPATVSVSPRRVAATW